jgi:hypothetical protein
LHFDRSPCKTTDNGTLDFFWQAIQCSSIEEKSWSEGIVMMSARSCNVYNDARVGGLLIGALFRDNSPQDIRVVCSTCLLTATKIGLPKFHFMVIYVADTTFRSGVHDAALNIEHRSVDQTQQLSWLIVRH